MATLVQEGREPLEHCHRLAQEPGRAIGDDRRDDAILVGGAQYVKNVAGRLASFTLIDSQPFKQSLYRKQFRPVGNRRRWEDRWP